VSEPSNALTSRNDGLVRLGDAPASTAPVAFEGETFEWADLPTATRRLARRDDPVLAERVVADDGLYESPSGVTQVLRSWRAHPGAVVVAVVLRPVRVDRDVLRAAGPWAHASLRSYDAAATPRRRAGVVASSVVVERRATPGSDPSAPHHAAAKDAWAYLPAVVRQSAENAVPVPEDWAGDLRQITDAGQPMSQEIVVLRRSASVAAVVVARRSAPALVGATTGEVAQRLAREPWSVEQLTYDLREPALLGPSTPPAGLPWA
jgi:hypothetical protein